MSLVATADIKTDCENNYLTWDGTSTPLTADDKPDGEPQLVIDNLGAGLDDRVLICNDGAGTRKLMDSKNSPVRWFVMGICDAH